MGSGAAKGSQKGSSAGAPAAAATTAAPPTTSVVKATQVQRFSDEVIMDELVPEGPPRLRQSFFVGANWKCSIDEVTKADKLITELSEQWALQSKELSSVEVCIFPPFTFLDRVRRRLTSELGVGAQNVGEARPADPGTGSVTPKMLRQSGCSWVMLGHSDRRNRLGETDALIARKVVESLKVGLGVNLTVGETLAARQAGVAVQTILCQLGAAAASVPADAWGRVVVAYEPVWAIGEGATPCSPADAQEVLGAMRVWLSQKVGPRAAASCRLAYTGSVNEQNAPQYAELPDVDGFVLGRAGLDAAQLLAISRTLAFATKTGDRPLQPPAS